MAENRELLGIDPKTVVAGVIRRKDSLFSDKCPLAKGRNGSWYYQDSLASRLFGIGNFEVDTFGPNKFVKGFSGKVRDAYNERFCTTEDKEQVALGLVAAVKGDREIGYNHCDLALWQKIGERDGLEFVLQSVPEDENGFWTIEKELE